jgi:hypothetical protein
LSILRHLLRQLRHFHGDKARRRRRRKPAVVPWSFPLSRRGESRVNRGENGGEMEMLMGHHGRFTKKGRFSNGQMDVFFCLIHLKWRFIAGNPSKSIVHMTVHRENNENIWKRRIFQQALLDRGMVAFIGHLGSNQLIYCRNS